jgi:hypothetical protein
MSVADEKRYILTRALAAAEKISGMEMMPEPEQALVPSVKILYLRNNSMPWHHVCGCDLNLLMNEIV